MAVIPAKNRSYHGTLVAASVDTVTLTRNYARVQVINRGGTNEIYYTLDGTAPTVGGDNCFIVTNQAGASDIKVNPQAHANTCVVNLISTGAMTYSVVGVDNADIGA